MLYIVIGIFLGLLALNNVLVTLLQIRTDQKIDPRIQCSFKSIFTTNIMFNFFCIVFVILGIGLYNYCSPALQTILESNWIPQTTELPTTTSSENTEKIDFGTGE